MITAAPTVISGINFPPLNPSLYLGCRFDGANYLYVEKSDLTSSPLTSGISAFPIPPIVQLFNGSVAINSAFFGCTSANSTLAGWNLGWRRIQDSNFCNWGDIETSSGVYNSAALARLDAIVSDSTSKGYELCYLFQEYPAWATGAGVHSPLITQSSLTSFVNFLTARYSAAQIKYYEGLNEPNVAWTGTNAQLVTHQQTLYNAVVAAGGGRQVISPSFTFRLGVGTLDTPATVNLDAYLAAGGGAYSHIIGYHPYTQRQFLAHDRTILPAVKAVLTARSIAQPLWVTEIGDSAPTITAVLQCAIDCAWQGVARMGWLSYDETTGGAHGNMSLTAAGVTAADWNAVVAAVAGKTLTQVNARAPYNYANVSQYGTVGAVIGGLQVVA